MESMSHTALAAVSEAEIDGRHKQRNTLVAEGAHEKLEPDLSYKSHQLSQMKSTIMANSSVAVMKTVEGTEAIKRLKHPPYFQAHNQYNHFLWSSWAPSSLSEI